jgi:hypothetical protein
MRGTIFRNPEKRVRRGGLLGHAICLFSEAR